MSLTKRHINVDGDMPVRDLLELLGVEGDSVTVLMPSGEVQLRIRAGKAGSRATMTFQEKKELARSAIGSWQGLIDPDELERSIYARRDEDPIKPPVDFD